MFRLQRQRQNIHTVLSRTVMYSWRERRAIT